MTKNTSNMNVHYSSKTNEWSTPQEFYNRLDKRFGFTLDPATDGHNAKCDKFYTEQDNGLEQDWGRNSVYEPTLRQRN